MSKHQLEQCVRSSLDQYFLDLNGSRPHDIYKMIVACVEKPMLEYLLERAQGNQSQAAESLGINRNTLRKKLQLYGRGSRAAWRVGLLSNLRSILVRPVDKGLRLITRYKSSRTMEGTFIADH